MAEDALPGMDDTSNAGPTEQQLLDAVMANSPIMEEAGIPLPTKEEPVEDPVESDDEDPESEEVVSEDYEEEVEEASDEPVEADDESTQSDVFTSETLDLDAKVAVKIDGEEAEVSFGDLIKGYSTEQSLSKKGRELGEARKELDDERSKKLDELDKVATASAAMITNSEQSFAKEYHDLEAKIQEARDEGNTYEMGELKDKREQVQKKYWDARKQREGLIKAVEEQKEKAFQEHWDQQIQHFNETIPTLIPDFDEKVAGNIRDFAIEEGIDPSVLDAITDPGIVKFVDDYRRLKQGVNKGQAKRKATPVKKAVPAKKPKTPRKKQQDKDQMIKARAFREDASGDDHMAFLRNHASKSLNFK